MKSVMKKIMAAALSIILIISCSAFTALAAANGKTESTADTSTETTQETTAQTETDSKESAVKESASKDDSKDTASSDSSVFKDETVYVLTDAQGNVNKVTVSDWIKNTDGAATITDTNTLENVENTSGDETYEINSENMRVWDAAGNDIYCTGTTDKTLPVTVKVSYKLDGKSISPEDLAGKSGKVTIRYDYVNNETAVAKIDGKNETLYVPFAMMTGMMLDKDKFSDVSVTNGKVVGDGSRIVVAGIAFPGLQEDLGLDSKDIEIPSYMEISATVTDFELENTVTIASNSLLNDIDTDNIASLSDLEDALSSMTSAMTQLMDGSSELYDGLYTLLDKSNELISGIDQLASGASTLKDGTASLASGANTLADSAKQLSDGLNTLASNNDSLNGGAEQVFVTLLNTVTTQLQANEKLQAAGISVPALTMDNYATVLNSIIASLDETNVAAQAQASAREQVTAAVEANREQVMAAVTSAVRTQVEAAVTAAVQQKVALGVYSQALQTEFTDYDQAKAAYDSAAAAGLIPEETQQYISASIDTLMASDDVKAQISANVDAQMASDSILQTISENTDAQIAALIEQNMNSEEVQGQITEALEAAASGAAEISSLKGQLDSYNTFYNGLKSYTAGVSQAASGASQLSAGASQLASGASQVNAGAVSLYNGIITLKDGAPALVSGVTQLKDGAMQLSDGLKQFNEEGIQKIADTYNSDVKTIITRLEACIDITKAYKSFSGLASGMDGSVNFIYETAAIEAE